VNTIYALYGDPAYPQSPYLIGGALSAAGSVKTSWSKSVSGGPPRGGRDVRQDFSTVQSVSFETKNEDLSAPSGKVLHHHRVLIIAMVNGGGRTIAQIAVGQIFGRNHVRGDSRNRDDWRLAGSRSAMVCCDDAAAESTCNGGLLLHGRNGCIEDNWLGRAPFTRPAPPPNRTIHGHVQY
jgi:hypothetical protein